MKKLCSISLLGFLLTVTGCAAINQPSADEEELHLNQQPISYETETAENNPENNQNDDGDRPRMQDYVDRLPSGQENTNYEQQAYNEMTARINKTVNELDEVNVTQSYIRKDRVIVAVMLNLYYDNDPLAVTQKVYRIVNEIVPNKKVEVYTDDIYWNEVRDYNAQIEGDIQGNDR
ncbi:YhcN/YlaJ family sporulation lipoprotein [Radiobacillus kanasensis]|uniref:YhcN/YlaJ family sporulation lipoprotein n=1 Tax=Radiobacillus kanasensis TaxID=2844358 RepID=UPI001E410C92|nr:YhcN/YlaJ family sporulation lipoprotein [Radiobacillus kanasensis]UFT97904.1 YhcN/YlaJ family sporulation lipoprotein [Radiobacillus kanasensis]